MIDHKENFINQKVEVYLKNSLQNHGWTHFSQAKCTQKHRKEIFIRVVNMLRLMGIAYETGNLGNTYKIKIVRKKDATYRQVSGQQNGRVSAKVPTESWNLDPFQQG